MQTHGRSQPPMSLPLDASIANITSFASDSILHPRRNRLYNAHTEGAKAMARLFQRIREARKLTGLSQEQLAGDLGVSRSAVAQ